MNPRRDVSRAVKRFHERWLKFLLTSSVQTMRRVAHELAAMELENAGYRDAAILCLLRKDLEFVIRDVTGSNWSVARSRNDLRGRTRGRRTSHDRVRVNAGVHRALWNQVSPFNEPLRTS